MNSEEIGNVESVKSIASIYAPMTGEVLEMNKAIDTDKGRPQLINRDPLGKGWILKMKATGKKAHIYLEPHRPRRLDHVF